MTPATPQARDLGHTVRLLADDIRTFGLELIRLGAEFHRDPNFMGDDEGREKFRRLIQVNRSSLRLIIKNQEQHGRRSIPSSSFDEFDEHNHSSASRSTAIFECLSTKIAPIK